MGRYQKSLSWAFGQFVNRLRQDISYRTGRYHGKPSRIIFCLTTRCNLKCPMCAFWRTADTKELSTEQWKKIILELKDWLGSYRVQIAGGEILLRNDIPELVRFGYENNVLMGMVSNGTIVTDVLARDLVESGLSYFDISLDGIRPETHDLIRGVTGVYEKAVATIQHLKRYRKTLDASPSIVVDTVVMGPNKNELIDIVRFVERENLNGVLFNPLGPPHDTNNREWYKTSAFWPQERELKKLDEVLDQLILLKRKGARILNTDDQFIAMKNYFRSPTKPRGFQCKVGETNFLMSCDGNVYACFHLQPLGMYGEPLRAVWYSERAKRIREGIRNCDHPCSPGNFIYTRSILKDIRRYFQYR